MKRCVFLLLACWVVACRSPENANKNHAGLLADTAMVVSAHPLATRIGIAILHKGGNAIDAAIAVQFALAVAFPAAGNIGGGGYMVVRLKDGTVAALDFREKAPGLASTKMYLDHDGNVIKDLSTDGHLASGVPGSVDGMVEAHKRYGTLPWASLVQPAIDLAINGVQLTDREANWFNDMQQDVLRYNTVRPSYLIKDQWKPSDTIKWTELAQTLERIRDNGRAGFYEGKNRDRHCCGNEPR